MLGRIKKSLNKTDPEGTKAAEAMAAEAKTAPQAPKAKADRLNLNVDVDVEEEDSDMRPEAITTPQRASEYMASGRSGVSLDGRSLVVPDYPDDVSSINTGLYTYEKPEARALGKVVDVEHGGDGDEGPITARARQYEHKNHDYSSQPNDAKTVGTTSSYDEGGCLPLWITEAPQWLKVIIILSTALLIGAIVLIGVGAALAVQNDQSNLSQAAQTPDVPSVDVSSVPIAPPMTDDGNSDDGGEGSAPTISQPSTGASDQSPVAPPSTGGDTDIGNTPDTPAPTEAHTESPTSSTVSFFVMGGRFIEEGLANLPQQLPTLPDIDGNAIMFHLGDWNSPHATLCSEESYQTNVELYQNSSVPVYFIPGDNEFNDCPDPDQAFQYWQEYMLGFETSFWPEATNWNITRQEPDHPENFAYVYNGLLIVGINLVGGVVHNAQEWQDRHAANLLWIEQQYYANQGAFDVMVVLAHADPEIQANGNFFETFYDRVANEYNIQVILVHRNLGVESWGLEPQYNGIANLMTVVVEGSVWPPMLVQIDTQAGTVDIDQSEWYPEYLATLPGGDVTTMADNGGV